VLSRGTAGFVFGAENIGPSNQIEVVNWNDDTCTDLIVGANVLLSPCNGAAPVYFAA
jgi:hypothetical protein